jgi:hypothetical protein
MSSKPLDINTYEGAELTAVQPARPEGKRERRAHRRIALDLAGGLSRDGTEFTACRVRDFCPDGMLVVLGDSPGDAQMVGGQAITSGEILALRFTAKLNGESHDHLARVRVARVSSSGLGISFEGENAEAVWQLRQLTSELKEGLRKSREQNRNARAPCAPMPVEQALNVGQMLNAAKQQTENFLTVGIEKLFKEAEDRLLLGSNEATRARPARWRR